MDVELVDHLAASLGALGNEGLAGLARFEALRSGIRALDSPAVGEEDTAVRHAVGAARHDPHIDGRRHAPAVPAPHRAGLYGVAAVHAGLECGRGAAPAAEAGI